jgi:MFS family permease
LGLSSRSSITAPLRNGNFRALWGATLVSNLGGLIQTVGAGWMMTQISDSKDLVAFVQAANTLPVMLFSLAAGALADNLDRRRIMLVAQCLMMAVSAGLAFLAFSGGMTPWLLLAFTFMIGCGTALHNPSWQASMGDIVPREDIPQAVSLNAMSFNIMRSIGPALGGAIVAAAGVAVAFVLNAVSYIPLIYALSRWKHRRPPSSIPREQFGSAMSAGLRYMLMSPNLMKVLFRGFSFGVGAVCVMALMPIIARDILQGGALTYGLLLGSFGVGAIGAALLNTRLRERFTSETIVRGAFLGFAASVVILAFSNFILLTCLLLVLAGACWVLSLSLFNVTVQLSTPRWVVGRALALYQMSTFGGMTLGSWLWGVTAEEFGAPNALLIASVALLLGAAIGLRFPLPGLVALDLDPLKYREPELQLDLKLRSGPIMIMVDYVIEQKNVDKFLEVMTERRRVRIRDGARQWALLRDLENPELWTESYHVPTWVEYIRHNQRRTLAEQELAEKLRELHKGPEMPRVHRMIERQTVPVRDDMPLKHHQDIP